VVEFGDWMARRAQLGALVSPFAHSHGRQVTATWISRSALSLGKRAVVNEDAVIEQVQRELHSRGLVIRKVVFEDLSVREQLSTARTSDILFGVHGAGLTHILWLPAHAVVLEVLPFNFNYFFYERVASASGLRYFNWQCDDAQRHVNCTNEHFDERRKFCNIVLPHEPILKLFERAILELQGEA
jgi:capsular polysaccharide biosynthesis protein